MNERSPGEAHKVRQSVKLLLREDGTDEGDLVLGAPRPPTPKGLFDNEADPVRGWGGRTRKGREEGP